MEVTIRTRSTPRRKYKKFLPEGEPNSVNAYDNTVVYTDHYYSGNGKGRAAAPIPRRGSCLRFRSW